VGRIYIYKEKEEGGAPPGTTPPRYPRSSATRTPDATGSSLPNSRVSLYRAGNTAPTAERKRYDQGRNSLHSLIGTACVCVCMMSFLVVSRPKGQISLDIYVGHSFVSSYVNVQIGCWLVSFGHSLDSWVSQQVDSAS